MLQKQSKTPGILLLILSVLGILFGITIAGLSLGSIYLLPKSAYSMDDYSSLTTTGLLSFTICIINFPTLIFSIKKLQQKAFRRILTNFSNKINFLIIIWLVILAVGYFISQNKSAAFMLAPFTIAAVSIPIWWLIEFSRRGLPRSTLLREWGTLTISTTIAPILIIIIEIIVVSVVFISVIVVLGFQSNNLNDQIVPLLENANLYQGGLEALERILYDLMKNPVVSIGIYLSIGLMAPLVEELLKPMAVWFLLKRPLKEYEGFALGLISGGAFALLESAGMIIQMRTQDWLAAVALRSATGVLHISLSGLVGFGLTRSWNRKQYWKGFFFILAAVVLHGGWNSLALLTGFSSSLTQGGGESFELNGVLGIFLLFCMLAIFYGIIMITLKIHAHLRHSLVSEIN